MKNEKVIIFGTGYQGINAYYYLREKHEILFFVDNDLTKQNKSFMGLAIRRPSELQQFSLQEVQLIIAIREYDSVCKQLDELGITSYLIMLDGHIYNKPEKKDVAGHITVCNRCVMDNASDKAILFDVDGGCSYCNTALDEIKFRYFPDDYGKKKLNDLLSHIKQNNQNKKYDCIMGVSGGLDSSYLLYLGYKWGLRVLAVHIDDGYDTEISKKNIEKLIRETRYDLEVVKPDKEQYNDLTLSFMKAGVPNIAIPQDSILIAFLYEKLKEYDIKYFLSGSNFALESILQKSYEYKYTDIENLLNIHKKYGTKPIDKLEFISIEKIKAYGEKYGIETYAPLNYIDYRKDMAINELKAFCGYEYYGSKHLENSLTAFAQLYWFPQKFGVDKRKSHLSSMIISGQLTREEAISIVSEPISIKEAEKYSLIVKNQLGLSDDEFDDLMKP